MWSVPLPSISDINAAHARIRPFIRRTPILRNQELDALAYAFLFFKCENFQQSGSFKDRGAHNAVFALDEDDARRGVVTHSSGNHGAALALAARSRGIPAVVVAPENSVARKLENIVRYGGRVVMCPPTYADREATAARIVRETGAQLIHSHDDVRVIAGQATAALELLDEESVDVIAAPAGGGGLISGVAIASRASHTAVGVVGAKPEGPHTIADGLRTPLCRRAAQVVGTYVQDIVRVSDDAIVGALQLIWSFLNIAVEPSSAAALAAVLGDRERFEGKRVGIILTGGNVDPSYFSSLVQMEAN